MIPDPLWLFHITHISNLPNILRQGGLLANNAVSGQYTNIAHQEIQTRRHSKQIAVKFSDIQQAGLPWVFTDGHAAMDFSEFYTDPAHFDQAARMRKSTCWRVQCNERSSFWLKMPKPHSGYNKLAN